MTEAVRTTLFVAMALGGVIGICSTIIIAHALIVMTGPATVTSVRSTFSHLSAIACTVLVLLIAGVQLMRFL